MEKQNFFIDRISTYHNLLKECYATLWYYHIFVFACCAWHPNLSMSLKNKLQAAQNSCIWFCLGMERRSHIGLNHFEENNWLPVKNRVDQCIVATTYNFKSNVSPVYMSDIYNLNSSLAVKTRSMDSFVEPNYVKELSSKSISYLGSKIWNGSDKSIRTSTSTNSFKHTHTDIYIYRYIYIYIYSTLL